MNWEKGSVKKGFEVWIIEVGSKKISAHASIFVDLPQFL